MTVTGPTPTKWFTPDPSLKNHITGAINRGAKMKRWEKGDTLQTKRVKITYVGDVGNYGSPLEQPYLIFRVELLGEKKVLLAHWNTRSSWARSEFWSFFEVLNPEEPK